MEQGPGRRSACARSTKTWHSPVWPALRKTGAGAGAAAAAPQAAVAAAVAVLEGARWPGSWPRHSSTRGSSA